MIWAKTSSGGIYKHRRATETPFYSLVSANYAEFERVYPERYRNDFGFWRPVIGNVVGKFLECGDLHQGFARIRCGDCGHEMFVPFSCKQRCFCSSCHQKRALNTSQHLAEDVCEPIPHRQFVFTIPKRFRLYFRYDRSLLGKMALCAWQTIRDVYQELLGEDFVPGMITAVQTFGELIHWHPHIHALVTDGAFSPSGIFKPLADTPASVFCRVWEHHVFRILLDEGRIDQKTVESMRCWKHSGFSVHKDVFLPAGDSDGIEKLAQYIVRSPFSQQRIMFPSTPDGKVLYRAEHNHARSFPLWRSVSQLPGPMRNFEVYDPLDFLAQVTQHIPNRYDHQIRYYGWYSNKSRGLRAKKTDSATARITVAEETPSGMTADYRKKTRRQWAALIKKVYEVDPLVCPECGGRMKVISFIQEPALIEKILRHIGLWAPTPRSPPPTILPELPVVTILDGDLPSEYDYLE